MTNDPRTQRERMLAGDLYLASDPELQSMLQRAARLLERIDRTSADDDAVRATLFRDLLGALGEGSQIRGSFRCDYGCHIRIGAGCFVNYGLVALDVAHITIGRDVQIGPNVQLLTAKHPLDAALRRAKWESAAPIVIGDNVWLGGGVIVCPGVSIGNDTVVGAGAVVAKSLPPKVLAVGNPARVMRSLL